MKNQLPINYSILHDKKLVTLILAGNEEAGVHLVYVKYENDINYHVLRYYDDLEYKEDLTNDLYIHLRGEEGKWNPLRSFQWRCTLRTWFNSVVSHFFLKKRKELIGFSDCTTSIDKVDDQQFSINISNDDERNTKLVILLEAINRLPNEDYRFILIKEIEGYSAKEIADLLNQKRNIEHRLRLRTDGTPIVATADYIYMIKNRALRELENIIKILQNEWYGD